MVHTPDPQFHLLLFFTPVSRDLLQTWRGLCKMHFTFLGGFSFCRWNKWISCHLGTRLGPRMGINCCSLDAKPWFKDQGHAQKPCGLPRCTYRQIDFFCLFIEEKLWFCSYDLAIKCRELYSKVFFLARWIEIFKNRNCWIHPIMIWFRWFFCQICFRKLNFCIILPHLIYYPKNQRSLSLFWVICNPSYFNILSLHQSSYFSS